MEPCNGGMFLDCGHVPSPLPTSTCGCARRGMGGGAGTNGESMEVEDGRVHPTPVLVEMTVTLRVWRQRGENGMWGMAGVT